VPDIAGPRVYEIAELLRGYLKTRHKHRLIVPIRFPGKAARAFRAGANPAPDGVVGRRTWEEFLRTGWVLPATAPPAGLSHRHPRPASSCCRGRRGLDPESPRCSTVSPTAPAGWRRMGPAPAHCRWINSSNSRHHDSRVMCACWRREAQNAGLQVGDPPRPRGPDRRPGRENR
jgi:hypothetical protein